MRPSRPGSRLAAAIALCCTAGLFTSPLLANAVNLEDQPEPSSSASSEPSTQPTDDTQPTSNAQPTSDSTGSDDDWWNEPYEDAFASDSSGVNFPAWTDDSADDTEDETEETEEAEGDRPEHRPGSATTNPVVPADEKLNGTDQTHPCAGRELLYHSHIDSPYVTRHEGKLAVMGVDGTAVKSADGFCLRLGPDGNSSGTEVSRMVVPDSPAYGFLGHPGELLWIAPMQFSDNWRPLWTGFGAFDPGHEWEVPTDFVGDSIKVKIVDFEGPGTMEIFNLLPGWPSAQRYFSSRDMREHRVQVGGHGHMNWTFSKAGIYKITWQAEGLHFDGSLETSEPTVQYWLVGTDADAGFTTYTTPDLNAYSTSAEDVRISMGLTEPTETGPVVAAGANDRTRLGEEDIKALNAQADSDDLFEWYHPVAAASGDVTMVVNDDPDDEYSFQINAKHGDSQTRASNQIIEVPDSMLRKVDPKDSYIGEFAGRAGGNWVWATASATESEDAPALSVDTSSLDYTDFNQQKVTMKFAARTQPSNSTVLAGLDVNGAVLPVYDSARSANPGLQMLQTRNYPIRMLFTQPGVYKIDFEADAPFAEGVAHRGDTQLVTFLVGNEAINAYRAKMDTSASMLATGEEPTADVATIAGYDPSHFPLVIPGSESADPEPATPSTTPPQPTAPATVKPECVELNEEGTAIARRLQSVWADQIPSHVVTRGHMDLAAGVYEGAVGAYLHDTADPAHPAHRDSGSFAIAVPDKARVGNVFASLGSEFADEAYALPQVQDPDLPWLGFNTESLYSPEAGDLQLDANTPATVTMENVDGPGRVVTGHAQLGTFETVLDGATPNSSHTYPGASHDHQYFIFSEPGVYSVDFVYRWIDRDGAEQTHSLHTYFLVGDTAVTLGRHAVDHQRFDLVTGVSPECSATTDEETEPSSEPSGKPSDEPSQPEPTTTPTNTATTSSDKQTEPASTASSTPTNSAGAQDRKPSATKPRAVPATGVGVAASVGATAMVIAAGAMVALRRR